MKENVTYSFVIPHHNTPELLNRLINSIPQREDIEIIVVDDNSDEDKKANVIRPDVKIIFIDAEQTKGAGRARNVGMDVATGKWLLFADADDFYKPNFIDILDEYKDEEIEMLFFNIDSVDSDSYEPNQRSQWHQKMIYSFDGSKKLSDKLLFCLYAPWRRMVKSEYIKKNGFRFEETLRGNDMFFSIQVSYFAKKWKVDPRFVYTLTHYNGSLTYGKSTKTKYKTLLLIYRRMEEFYKYIGHSEWNRTSKGIYVPSTFKQIYRFFKISRMTGIEAFFYYITHWLEIERMSHYYIDVIKDIERKRICKDIVRQSMKLKYNGNDLIDVSKIEKV